MSKLAVILPAAGSSTRFGASKNKLRQPLGRSIVLEHSLRAFSRRSDVAAVLLAVDDATFTTKEIKEISLTEPIVCRGGACRAESVLFALRLVEPEIEWVAIHDAARPLISQQLIDRTFAAAKAHGAAAPALPVGLTIKQATGPLPAKVQKTVARNELWAMQTPQIARRAELLEAFEKCPIPLDQITDDLQLLELAGIDVWLVPGDERNIKITRPMDLQLAELMLQQAGES